MRTNTPEKGGDRVPIVVGIIGHRDLRDEETPELEQKVGDVFRHLRAQFRDTPLVLVTALAEGADLLGARVATRLGIPLIAPLPMEPREYRQTFASAAAAAEFDRFVKNATTHVCRAHHPEEDTDERRYARAGAAVVQYSHIVLALWDGVDTGLPAGTSYLVKHALEGIPQDIVRDLEGSTVSPLDPVSTALVRHIPVQRKSPSPGRRGAQLEARLTSERFAEVVFRPGGKVDLSIPKTEQRMFQNFGLFNRDLGRFRRGGESWSSLLEERDGYPALVSSEECRVVDRPGLLGLRERFAMADHLANFYQRKRHHLVIRIIVLLAALVAFVHQLVTSSLEVNRWIEIPGPVVERFESLGIIDLQGGWPFVLYGALVLIAYLIVLLVRQRRWQERYLDYRTLAEGVRIQFFWLLGGVRSPVVNFFLRKQRDELEWIRNVLRMWYLQSIIGDGFVADARPEQARLIREKWIRDQRHYGEKKAREMGRRDAVCCWVSRILVLLLLGSLVCRLFDIGSIADEAGLAKWIEGTPGEAVARGIDRFGGINFLLITFGALAGAAALTVSSFRHYFHYAEQQKAHSRLGVLFADGDRAFDPEDGIQEDERMLLEELGRESLADTGDWLLMNRKRKINLPR